MNDSNVIDFSAYFEKLFIELLNCGVFSALYFLCGAGSWGQQSEQARPRISERWWMDGWIYFFIFSLLAWNLMHSLIHTLEAVKGNVQFLWIQPASESAWSELQQTWDSRWSCLFIEICIQSFINMNKWAHIHIYIYIYIKQTARMWDVL